MSNIMLYLFIVGRSVKYKCFVQNVEIQLNQMKHIVINVEIN